MKSFSYGIIFCSIVSFAHAIEPKLVVVEGEQFITDLRYATPDNFLHKNVYREFGLNQCFVDEAMQAKLLTIVPELKKNGHKIVFWDCTRPLSVQKAMWKIVPDSRYVANPKTGSNHNRGGAIDVGLADENGQLLPMPSKFDDFTEKASASYPCPPEESKACENREMLRSYMTKAGLKGIKTEWWHFELPDAKTYPLRDFSVAKPK